MDNNNWRPIQGGEPVMDTTDWRTQFQPDSRQRIVNQIMDTLKKHLPFSGQEGLHELKKIAERFEEKIYTAATSQSDYFGKISLKMLTMETKYQNTIPNSLPSNPVGTSSRPPEPASVDSTAQTGHANGGDWQEEVYQKIKQMKDLYLHELRDMYEKIAAKLQQLDSLPQQPKLEQLDKLKLFKNTLERAIQFLQVPKGNIGPMYKEKLAHYEKQIISFINTNRPRKPVSQLQQGQHPQYHMHSMQQQPQSQINQVQSHEKQMNPQLQSMNLQSMQQNNMTSLQQHSMPAKCVLTTQQNVMNSSQSSSNVDSGQGNAQNSLQQVSMGSLQQNPVIAPQQANINALSLKNGINVLQPSVNNLEPNSNMLQHQHQLKQQEQQMIQKLKQQYHQWQLLQKQQIFQQQQQQQQLQQQAKPQIPAQLPSHQNQMLQLHQINDVNDMKMRQSMGAKPGVFQQHLPAGQRSAYSHQQLKSSSPFPISSSQLLQASSPQILQHSSPQVDQQNLLTSLTKPGTPLQSANSPFVVPSPSTPMAPSPMPGDSEKPVPSVSSLSNAGNVRQQQTSGAVAPAQSLSIGTPGISASPLLAEFSGPDGTHGNTLASVSVFSVMGKRRLLYALVVFGWILVTVTFILGGVFLLHNVFSMENNNWRLIQGGEPTYWRPLPETSSSSIGSTAQNGDWQEEVYQKIKTMKELYLPELFEMYQKIDAKLQQLDSLPQQPKLEQLDKLKLFKNTLERDIQFLQVPRGNIGHIYKEKLAHYEKQIISFINTNRPRNPVF